MAGTRPVSGWSRTTRAQGFEAIFAEIAAESGRRDVERDFPHDRFAQLKAAGYGRLRLPAAQGGAGLSLAQLFETVRDLGWADPNVAHPFRNHFHAVEEALRAPQEPLYERILRETAQGRTFGLGFGDAPAKRAGESSGEVVGRLEWDEEERAWSGSGVKPYSTGNIYADWLIGPAYESLENRKVRYLVATGAPGVDLADDWTGFGQKLTGSGNTRFQDARIEAGDVFPFPAPAEHNGKWRFTFHQVYLTSVIAGIALRIKSDAIDLVRGRRRNFYHGQAEEPRDEAVLQAELGRIAAHAAAIEALSVRAAEALQAAFEAHGTPEAETLTLQATFKATEAKIVTDTHAPQLAGWLIDLGSGSAVSTEAALDRHWRNIKVISAHNPRLYKERLLGDHLLNGTLPPTGAFF